MLFDSYFVQYELSIQLKISKFGLYFFIMGGAESKNDKSQVL